MAHLWQPTATPIYNITPYRWEVFFQIIPNFRKLRNFPRLQNFQNNPNFRNFQKLPMPPCIEKSFVKLCYKTDI